MRGFILNTNDKNDRMGEYLAENAALISITSTFNNKTIDDIEFDLDFDFKKGNQTELDFVLLTYTKTIKVDKIIEERKEYTYNVLDTILKIVEQMEELNKSFLEAYDGEYKSKINNYEPSSKDDYYDFMLYAILTINAHPTEEINLKDCTINVIGQFLFNYGFVRNVYDNGVLVNRCHIKTILLDFYRIYETYYLYQYLTVPGKIKNNILNKLLLFSRYEEELTNKKAIEYINYNLSKFEKLNECSFSTSYIDDKWDTKLIFKDSIALAYYELRMLVSQKDTERKPGTCERCLGRMEFYRKSKRFCSREDNELCYMARRNEDKQKSLANQKNNN